MRQHHRHRLQGQLLHVSKRKTSITCRE